MTEKESFHTLINAISYRCGQDPQGLAFVFLNENMQAQEVSSEQFYHDIQHYAAGLINKGVRPGEIVLIALDHGYELLCCFWGAICCGAIPSIMTYWRPGSDVDVYAQKIKNLAQAVRAHAVISQPDLQFAIRTALRKMNCLVFTNQDITRRSFIDITILPEPKGWQIGFMQFTSGTTGEPRAIQFSHQKILGNIAATGHAYQLNKDSVQVSWLPFYHDMGLIFHIMLLIYGGLQVIMSPQTWLRRPEILLQAVHRYSGTITNMPNFGFDYCAQHVRDDNLRNIDLSSWQVLTNGSEPAMLASMERFCNRFVPYGLRRSSLTVAYGMAENVCGISMSTPGKLPQVDWVLADDLHAKNRAIQVELGSAGARAILSCGHPFRGVELAIVDDQWTRLADREVGEIIIRSDTLFDGYYLASKDAENSFRDGWFRTGDIGYMVNGELFVCDRKKDLIIVGGRNIHPQAIENIAVNIFGPFVGRCAALGVNDPNLGTELPVLVLEERKHLDAVEKDNFIRLVRNKVLEELDVAIFDIRLVPKGWVVKTTSGKTARAANREKYLNEIKSDAEEQDIISPDELTDEQVEDILINLFEKVLGITDVGEEDNFFILGGDSLSAMRMLLAIERIFGQEISAEEFFQEPTIKNLTKTICKKSGKIPVMEIDEPPQRRRNEKDNCRNDEDLPRLFKDRLYKIKSRITQKAANIIPGWLFEQKCIQNILFSKQRQLIRQFYKLLENPLQSEKEVIECALCHVPYLMQEQLNKHLFLSGLKQWSLKLNMDTLEKAYQGNKGVIIVSWHSYSWINNLVQKLILRLEPNDFGYIGHVWKLLPKQTKTLPVKEQKRLIFSLFLDQLMKGKSILMQGGIVSILPDGYAGLSSGILFPFHGRIRSFKTGFAELAIETRAVVIPISLVLDFRVRQLIISSLEPMERGPDERSRAECIEGLIRHYVDFLKKEWTHSPGLISTSRMKKHLKLQPYK